MDHSNADSFTYYLWLQKQSWVFATETVCCATHIKNIYCLALYRRSLPTLPQSNRSGIQAPLIMVLPRWSLSLLATKTKRENCLCWHTVYFTTFFWKWYILLLTVHWIKPDTWPTKPQSMVGNTEATLKLSIKWEK